MTRRMKTAAAVMAIVVTGLGLAACSASGTKAAAPKATSAPITDATDTTSDAEFIYDPSADGPADLEAAIDRAGQRGTRVLIDFGADWCSDCNVLDEMFHAEGISDDLAANFELVKIDVDAPQNEELYWGTYDDELPDVIPGIVILGSNGKVVTSTADGSLEELDSMSAGEFRQLLASWAA